MPRMTGPRSWLDETQAELGLRAFEQQGQDVESQRQDVMSHAAAPAVAPAGGGQSFLSSIPPFRDWLNTPEPAPVIKSLVGTLPASFQEWMGGGQQQPVPTSSGTPAAMPGQPQRQTVDATITSGQRVTGDASRPGDGLGSVQMIAGAGTRASRFAPLIAQVAAEEGVPADVLAAILDTENSGETSVSPAGARGLMQVVPGQGFDLPGEDASDPLTSIRQGARALREKHRMAAGDWDRAGQLYFGVGVDAGGVSDSQYLNLYRQNRAKYGQQTAAPPAPEQAAGGTPITAPQAQGAWSAGSYTPNQIEAATAEGLDYETALAVCGPAAAIAFARKNGRNPTMAEAVNLAKQVGWTPQQGMAGPASQQRLLQNMGVAARLVEGSPDWKSVAADVQRGNPVTISTPGHYFVAERYDPESGMFDFGESARVLKASGGRRWFRPDELVNLGMGDARATLFIDNPESPTPSIVADPRQSAMNAGGGSVPQSPASSPAGPAASSSGAGLPASVRERWVAQFKREPDAQEIAELMGVLA